MSTHCTGDRQLPAVRKHCNHLEGLYDPMLQAQVVQLLPKWPKKLFVKWYLPLL